MQISRRTSLLGIGLVSIASVLVACTGPRPRLGAVVDASGQPPTRTGDQTVDTMVQGLEHHDGSVFTASYRIERRFGSKVSTAVVVVDRGRTSITIGDVLILRGATEQTCSVAKKTCERGVAEAQLSDIGVTSHFFDTSPARRLRVAMTRRTGPPTPSTATIAGVAVTCVSVPITVAATPVTTNAASPTTTTTGSTSLGAGVERYCTTADGVLAAWEGADVDVQLTALSSTIAESAFKSPA